jgi:hypothetical protein
MDPLIIAKLRVDGLRVQLACQAEAPFGREGWWRFEDFLRTGTGAMAWRAASRKQKWWARQDSNLEPDGYEPSALTIELRALSLSREAWAGQAPS